MGLIYCGNVEKTIVFNAVGFKPLWFIIKQFIPEHVQKRILFFNDSKLYLI